MRPTAQESETDLKNTLWPALQFNAWKDSCATLHMWMQIAGKIRLACAPMVNHWWQVPLYVSSRGLTTSAVPYRGRNFQIDFDFIAHRLVITSSDGRSESFALGPRAVADFYAEIMGRMRSLDLEIRIWTTPVEVPDPVPFEHDRVHASYDAEAVNRFWRALLAVDQVLTVFRGRFIGKASPVHFFWGGFDMAVTRFSGRRAPPPPHRPNIPDSVNREAYSHEVSSCGFWPGNGGFGEAAFYAYAYAEPNGFAESAVAPREATYSRELGEFILPYDKVRASAAPHRAVLDFLQTTYEAAANCGRWDRAALERQE
jgi:hypothetical protein